MFDLMCFCLAKDQNGVILPNEPDRSRLRGEIGIDTGQPNDIFILEMSLYGAPKFGIQIDHWDACCFIRSATNSATSLTCMVPPSALDASFNIVIQNGQPTASVSTPVSFAC